LYDEKLLGVHSKMRVKDKQINLTEAKATGIFSTDLLVGSIPFGRHIFPTIGFGETKPEQPENEAAIARKERATL